MSDKVMKVLRWADSIPDLPTELSAENIKLTNNSVLFDGDDGENSYIDTVIRGQNKPGLLKRFFTYVDHFFKPSLRYSILILLLLTYSIYTDNNDVIIKITKNVHLNRVLNILLHSMIFICGYALHHLRGRHQLFSLGSVVHEFNVFVGTFLILTKHLTFNEVFNYITSQNATNGFDAISEGLSDSVLTSTPNYSDISMATSSIIDATNSTPLMTIV